MKTIRNYLFSKPYYFLLLIIPVVFIGKLSGWGSIWIFVFSAVGVIPLAGLIGDATEMLAHYTGPKIGGLLNSTLGNAAELIITLVALKEGLISLVKASITGSIIGNLLFVLGFSMLFGGIKNGTQKFNRQQSANHAILLAVIIIGLIIPSLFSHTLEYGGNEKSNNLSIGVAIVMIFLYGLGLVYSVRYIKSPIAMQKSNNGEPIWSIRTSILILVLSTLGIVYLSELLVGAVEDAVRGLGISEFFLGIFLIPIIGNIAEHFVAVRVAHRNQMDLSVEISLSSSIQVAMFVAPICVFTSEFFKKPMDLVFNEFELIALGSAVLITGLVSSDGESNWFEGCVLLGIYILFGFAFFLMPV